MRRNTYNIMDFYRGITQQHPLRYGHQFTVEFLGRSLDGIMAGDFVAENPTNIKDNITYYVQSSKIPDVTIAESKVSYLAAGFVVPGVVKYPEAWDVEILLDQDLTQYNRLRSWQEAMSSYTLSAGGYKTIPNVVARVNLLDNTMMRVVKTYIMEGVWIKDLGSVSMQYSEGGGSDVAKCKCTFTMQYWYEEGEGDPLGATSY